jgi:hypothetical protein
MVYKLRLTRCHALVPNGCPISVSGSTGSPAAFREPKIVQEAPSCPWLASTVREAALSGQLVLALRSKARREIIKAGGAPPRGSDGAGSASLTTATRRSSESRSISFTPLGGTADQAHGGEHLAGLVADLEVDAEAAAALAAVAGRRRALAEAARGHRQHLAGGLEDSGADHPVAAAQPDAVHAAGGAPHLREADGEAAGGGDQHVLAAVGLAPPAGGRRRRGLCR